MASAELAAANPGPSASLDALPTPGASAAQVAASETRPHGFRVERDSMGEVLVPASAWYGPQTARAVANFPVSGQPLPPELLAALALVKQACAEVNAELGVIDSEVGAAIAASAAEIAAALAPAPPDGSATSGGITPNTTAPVAGLDPDWSSSRGVSKERAVMLAQFPVDVYQTGSGTSSNMNMNEVLATMATHRLADASTAASPTQVPMPRNLGDPAAMDQAFAPRTPGVAVHPNDTVNASQSSNDVFPTAIHLAAAQLLHAELDPALGALVASLTAKAAEFANVVKAGRTHLMDATPVTLGQEFAGCAAAVERSRRALTRLLPDVAEVPLGGTAVGTGINTPPGFGKMAAARLAALNGLPVTEAANHMAAQWDRGALVSLSGELRALAVALTKVCNDLRWMGSGPNAGLAEIHIPDLQPGSSIMPGKVNPVIPESMLMVCARVVGNDATVAWAAASGNFELNVAMPVLAVSLLESLRLLANASRLLATKCVDGVTANVARCVRYAGASPSIVTALNPLIGYERAAEVAKHAVAHQLTIREAVLDLGLIADGSLTEAQLDQRLNLLPMANPAN